MRYPLKKEISMLRNSKAFSSFSTNDLTKTKAFYVNILGLDVVEEGEMGLRMNLSGGTVFIYPKVNHAPANFTVLNFSVDDIDKVADALAAKGVVLERYEGFEYDEKGICRNNDPEKGPAAIAWFKDPTENIISILQEEVK